MDRREELEKIIGSFHTHANELSNGEFEFVFTENQVGLADAILYWLDEHYVDKPKYDGGIIKGPFKDCDCESHHQHGINGPQGCVVCNPPVEHYEEKK